MPPIYLGESPKPKQLWRWLVISIVLVVVGSVGVTVGLAYTIANHDGQPSFQSADVIIVLGAGSPTVVSRRASHAATLWHDGVADNIICTGGDIFNGRRSESEFCERTLLRLDVPSEAIHLETESRSTEENAIHASTIMKQYGWRSAIVVSDDYHLWRAQLIFEEQFESTDWAVTTSSAQLTQSPVPRRFYGNAVFREVMATYWHVGKGILGLPYTDFPRS